MTPPTRTEYSPQERKAIYLEYMKMKIAEEDWHGVADCAMDLREIEVEISLEPQLMTPEERLLFKHLKKK